MDNFSMSELLAGDNVLQSFTADKNYLSGISVTIATFHKTISTTICFQLFENDDFESILNNKNKNIHSKNINTNIIIDNDEYNFYFPIIKNSKNKRYTLLISSIDGTPNNAITLWVTNKDKNNVNKFNDVHFDGEVQQSLNILCTPRFSSPLAISKVPPALLYSPVTACNMECIHCISKETRGKTQNLSAEIKQKISFYCKEGQIKTLASDYSGDIIFANQKYGELDYLIGLNTPFSIDNNAQIMNKSIAKKLLTSKMYQINFSLDAGTKDTYKKIRIGKVPYNEVLDNIRLFSNIKKAEKANHIKLLISIVLMKQNIHELNLLIDFADEIGVDTISCIHLQVYDESLDSESLFNNKELYNIWRNQLSSYATLKKVNLLLPPPFENLPNRSGHRYCNVPWTSSVILGNGDVMVCCIPNTVIGNLYENSLEDIWNGVKYQEFRSKVNSDNPPESCSKCPIFRYPNNRKSFLFYE